MPAPGTNQWLRAVETSALDQIGIGPIHDSPSRRNLLLATSEMARHECLSLQAIDDPKDGSVEVTDRGAYMADRLLALTDSAEFVVVLVGNLHPLRHLDWNFDHDEKPVSRYLADAGLPLYVVLQDWKQQDGRTKVFQTESTAGLDGINQLLGVASVKPAKSLHRYGDVLIDWGTR